MHEHSDLTIKIIWMMSLSTFIANIDRCIYMWSTACGAACVSVCPCVVGVDECVQQMCHMHQHVCVH